MLFPLKSVHIRNFRGLRDVELVLDPRVTVLFGSNAAGKTSVLDAIAIALGAYPSRLPKAKGRDFAKTGDLRLPWLTRLDVQETAGVEAAYAHVELVAEAATWGVLKRRFAWEPGVPKLIGKEPLHALVDAWAHRVLEEPAGSGKGSADGAGDGDGLGSGAGTGDGAGSGDGSGSRAGSGAGAGRGDGSGHDDRSPVILPLVAAYGTERAVVEIPLRERDFASEFTRLGALDQSLRATTRFKAVFEWFRIEEDEERRERERRKSFDYELPALSWVRRAVERAGLRCRNPRVETKPIRMLVDFVHEGDKTEELDITSLSDGYRTHFALVVDIARRMVQLNPSENLDDPERGTNTEAVVLIDEVDLHLDPVWQGRVVSGLQKAFPRTQFILTTHSEQVIASVSASCVRKLVWTGGEIVAEAVPFAQGATGEEILVDLMGAPIRVPGEVTTDLERYAKLVNEDAQDSEEALALRARLEAEPPGRSALVGIDLDIERRRLLKEIHGDRT